MQRFFNFHIFILIFIQKINAIGINHYLQIDSIQNTHLKVENLDENQNSNIIKSDSIKTFKLQKGYFSSLINNFGKQTISPFHLNKKQMIAIGIGVGVSGFLIKYDGEIDEFAKNLKSQNSFINFVSPKVTELGGNYGLIALSAFGLGSVLFKNEYGKQTTILASQAFITSSIWLRLTKILSGRERPMANYLNSKQEGGAWYGPFAQWDQDLAIHKSASSFDAFASGHTATAFSIATVLATRYKNAKAIPIISYSLASMVGISRLTEHEHWASDVFVGAIFGYLCGKQVVKNYNKMIEHNDDGNEKNTKPKLVLTQKGNQFGLAYKW